MLLHMPFVILTHSDISVIFNLAWGQLRIPNCLCRKKHKHQKGKRFGHKWGPSSVPTILICIKNKTYTLDRQNPCKLNSYFVFLVFFFFFF